MARHVSPRTLAVQRALGAFALAGAVLGAAAAAAHAHPLAAAAARPAVAPLDGGALSDFTGPLVQADIPLVQSLEGTGGFLTGQS
ncbi:hypothetical protein J2Z21_002336 [Streptomyces griseochromogenes]|uniref:Uncharacterized protein n=1 Tax=Streptomyces griseochromogenes TaxID=68214 RepID=A0A1B1ARC4_9ACTN|nr:hypothetical protein [Streptomyces griseochromogenes]ANP49072.1 hypothetical protein AVL59_05295 [Streptomyces griseochromogenes]MBP2049405.1 hypothetical protein [Streptomyces griseochromogenes]